jgi:hypothetical protein
MDRDEERRIRERAYEIWEREGRPVGRAEEHWRQAATEIAAETSAASPGQQPAPAPEPPLPSPAQGAPEAPVRRSRPVPRRTGSNGATSGRRKPPPTP